MIKKPLYFLILFCLLALWLWCTAAIYFMFLPAVKLPLIASALFAFNLPFMYFLLPNKKQAVFIAFVLCASVFVYWSQIKPSHDRNWEPNVARLPYAKTAGNEIKIYNIRNFDYITEDDFQINYYD